MFFIIDEKSADNEQFLTLKGEEKDWNTNVVKLFLDALY